MGKNENERVRSLFCCLLAFGDNAIRDQGGVRGEGFWIRQDWAVASVHPASETEVRGAGQGTVKMIAEEDRTGGGKGTPVLVDRHGVDQAEEWKISIMGK